MVITTPDARLFQKYAEVILQAEVMRHVWSLIGVALKLFFGKFPWYFAGTL